MPERGQSVAGESPWRRGWRRYRRHRLAMLGAVALSLLVLLAVFAPLVSPYSPYALNLPDRAQAPSAKHWLGTDNTGRDTWARTILAGRVSLSVGLVAVSIATLVGTLVGSVAGFFGGRTDALLMRVTDVVMTFPALIVIIALVSVFGPSIYNTMIGIGLLTWPTTARLVRGEFLTLREQPFVEAAKGLGATPLRLIFRHVLPNALGPIVVAATFGVASAILLEAGLSFLGSRGAAAHTELGQYAERRAVVDHLRNHALALGTAGCHDSHGRAKHQLRRGRPS